jgi:membrane associated rhomboid family serine protease
MHLRVVWIFSNAAAVVTTLVCMSYLYYACRPVPRRRLPVFSLLVIGVTAVVSGLQFVYPGILTALQRDPDAVRAGELWRLVTALFVQPNGISQYVANGFLILAFMPAAERLYGRNILVVYFAAGFAGQTVNYFWDSGAGGSSTAIFGVMGSVLIYVIRNRRELLLPFAFIAGAGLLSALVMLLSRDGHGAGLVVGATIASMLPVTGMIFRSKETDAFAPPQIVPDDRGSQRAGA